MLSKRGLGNTRRITEFSASIFFPDISHPGLLATSGYHVKVGPCVCPDRDAPVLSFWFFFQSTFDLPVQFLHTHILSDITKRSGHTHGHTYSRASVHTHILTGIQHMCPTIPPPSLACFSKPRNQEEPLISVRPPRILLGEPLLHTHGVIRTCKHVKQVRRRARKISL